MVLKGTGQPFSEEPRNQTLRSRMWASPLGFPQGLVWSCFSSEKLSGYSQPSLLRKLYQVLTNQVLNHCISSPEGPETLLTISWATYLDRPSLSMSEMKLFFIDCLSHRQ